MKKIWIPVALFVVGLIFLGMALLDTTPDVYAIYGLEGLSTEAMVETLDEQTLDGNIIGAAILETELVIHTTSGTNTYPIDADLFYLSIAPYINSTHPCHNHNLVTCRGELANETVSVYIESTDGDVLFDDDLTLYDNGFKGIWLPSDIDATITITYDDLSVSHDFGTYEDSGTCMTEPLKLS